MEELKSFQHNAEYVKIVVKENDENEITISDDYYNNKLMNEISLNSWACDKKSVNKKYLLW